MYAQLGTTVFDGLKSFVSFSTSEEAVLVEHALINRKPRLQGSGLGLVQLSISLFLHQEFCNVKDEVSKLRKSKDTYEVLPLLWGNGDVEGDFVIASMNRDVKQNDALGNVISATISLTLKEFVKEDTTNTQQQQAQKNAFASGDKRPATKSTRVNPVSCNSFVSKEMSVIQSNGAKVDGYMHTYTKGSVNNSYALTSIKIIKAESAKLVHATANPQYPCLADKNAPVTYAWSKIDGACNALTGAIQIGDKAGVDLYNATLQVGIRQMQAAVTKNIQQSAVRK